MRTSSSSSPRAVTSRMPPAMIEATATTTPAARAERIRTPSRRRSLRKRGIADLMLTAKDGDYDQADALDLGADDYLTKPFAFVVLIARLRALIRRGAPERPAVLRSGDLTLDPAERQIRLGDEPVSVTPREFAMLEFLMRHPGQAMTKTAILENVWDAHFDGDPNIVEVYIGYLRKKIGRERIETVRGAGYRVAEHAAETTAADLKSR
ncbi:response regulator transcription factor [Paractinoplanes atraurantiacus]|uniref:response regulator transcription factor n=1 Tax=Paractinoplanes atraurantiacus TaxID=1036182 RepID=UPI003F68BF87